MSDAGAPQEKPEEKLYRLGREVPVTVLVVNNSDQRIRVEVIDLYYGNRFQLFKDGVLVPYREETAKLVQSKDDSPRVRLEAVRACSFFKSSEAAEVALAALDKESDPNKPDYYIKYCLDETMKALDKFTK